MMPNTAYFHNLCKIHHQSLVSSSPTTTEPNTPETLYGSRIIVGPPSYIPTTANALSGHGITRQYALFLDFDEESDGDEDELTVQILLEYLHNIYPLLNYLQFDDSLRALGIHYLVTASILDADFYIRRVGMLDGMAHIFCDEVSNMLKKGVGQRCRAEKKGVRRGLNI